MECPNCGISYKNKDSVVTILFNTANAREFRATGYSINAAHYFLSKEAYERKLKFNRVPEGYDVPHAWRFAPNEYVKNQWEEKS